MTGFRGPVAIQPQVLNLQYFCLSEVIPIVLENKNMNFCSEILLLHSTRAKETVFLGPMTVNKTLLIKEIFTRDHPHNANLGLHPEHNLFILQIYIYIYIDSSTFEC